MFSLALLRTGNIAHFLVRQRARAGYWNVSNLSEQLVILGSFLPLFQHWSHCDRLLPKNMIASLRLRERFRTAVIAGLMLVSLLMMGLLSHQTYIAVSSQQQLVEGVLRDYSSLAADEFVRRSAAVANYGFYPMLSYLSGIPSDTPLPDRERFKKIVGMKKEGLGKAGMELARSFFRFTPGGSFEISDGSPPEAVIQQLLSDLESIEVNEPTKFARTFHMKLDGEHFNFIYRSFDDDVKQQPIVGIWIDNEMALEWLEYFVTSKPLLPSTLTQDKLDNESVFIKLLSGRDVIYTQGTYDPDSQMVGGTFDNSNAIYGDMSLALAIDPAVGASLIIGGLPESRLPFIYGDLVAVFWGLWFVAALLMMIAFFLLYRERSVAYMRSDFVSRVSHELRTPLAQIMMFAQTLMLGRVRTEEDRQRSLEVIDKEAQRLSHLVDNILQFAKAERGQTDINIVRQPLYPLIREIAEQFRPMMKEGQLVITSEVGDETEVQLDVDAFKQMFMNLLDNAVKFSPAGENVDICLSKSSDRINVAIEDRGPGVPAKEQRRIWEPYYRASETTRSAVGGTGIGLAVVNELARLQAAYVSMTERKGGGSRFVIGFDIASGSAG